MQVLFLKMFPLPIDTFSTVINRDINGKEYLCGEIMVIVSFDGYDSLSHCFAID